LAGNDVIDVYRHVPRNSATQATNMLSEALTPGTQSITFGNAFNNNGSIVATGGWPGGDNAICGAPTPYRRRQRIGVSTCPNRETRARRVIYQFR